MATTDATSDDPTQEHRTADADATAEEASEPTDTANQRRARRAREEDMEVALRRQGGIYEVESESDNVYEVDILEHSCTCPDSQQTDPPGGCKHVRRVEADVEAGRVPRPDGKLPTNPAAAAVVPDGGDLGALDARIREALREREDQLATVEAELRALTFVCDVLTALRPETDTDLNDVLHRPHDPQ